MLFLHCVELCEFAKYHTRLNPIQPEGPTL